MFRWCNLNNISNTVFTGSFVNYQPQSNAMGSIDQRVKDNTTPIFYTERERVMYERLGQSYAWYKIMEDEWLDIEQKCLDAFYTAWPQLKKFDFQSYKEISSNKPHVLFEIQRVQIKHPVSPAVQTYLDNLLIQRDLIYPEWLRAQKALEYIESEKAYLRALKDVAHN